jgi:hypothetical protein
MPGNACVPVAVDVVARMPAAVAASCLALASHVGSVDLTRERAARCSIGWKRPVVASVSDGTGVSAGQPRD